MDIFCVCCRIDDLSPHDASGVPIVVPVGRWCAELFAEIIQFVVLGLQLLLGSIEKLPEMMQGRQLQLFGSRALRGLVQGSVLCTVAIEAQDCRPLPGDLLLGREPQLTGSVLGTTGVLEFLVRLTPVLQRHLQFALHFRPSFFPGLVAFALKNGDALLQRGDQGLQVFAPPFGRRQLLHRLDLVQPSVVQPQQCGCHWIQSPVGRQRHRQLPAAFCVLVFQNSGRLLCCRKKAESVL
ncbi:hypothetical protein AS200_00385 [Streptomyces sp. CdTB01]|nr:hypothetical protein AS200_00385 [Streptomyces sp. CdTB01]